MSVFIARGFQNQIRTKVIGFGSHIQVLPFLEDVESGSDAIPIAQDFYKDYKKFDQIQSMQPVAYKPGILQRIEKNEQGNREIQGVLFKGIDKNYDWDFIKKNLVTGKAINFDQHPSKEIMISQKIADNLSVKVGDTLASVLISKNSDNGVSPVFRKFRICGIYETGLEEFDKEYVFIDLAHIQEANGWGIHVVLSVNDTLKSHDITPVSNSGRMTQTHSIKSIQVALNAATNADKLDWTVNGVPYNFNVLYLPLAPGKYTIVAADSRGNLVSDTALISVQLNDPSPVNGEPDAYLKHIGDYFVKVSKLDGSQNLYAGGFEINLKNWDDLMHTDEWLYKMVGPGLSTKTIIEQQQHIFNWLDLVELNVTIIVGLMLLVAIINLISAILVLILERSKMIGVLKSFGASSKTVGKIFFYFTSSILIRGLVFGNLLAMLLFFIQNYTGIIQLDPQSYFVSSVPVMFDWKGFLFINALTLTTGLLAFFLPVLLVTRINPVKAIKIE